MVKESQNNLVGHFYCHNSQDTKGSKKTAEEWNEIWLRKFDRIVSREVTDTAKFSQMRKILSIFLKNNPGSPYQIPVATVCDYLKGADRIGFEAIKLFYSKVAVSRFHQELCKEYTHYRKPSCEDAGVRENEIKPENSGMYDNRRKALLDKLRLEINARNYSARTLDNYAGAVSRFLTSLRHIATHLLGSRSALYPGALRPRVFKDNRDLYPCRST